jgi:hypothetical protein
MQRLGLVSIFLILAVSPMLGQSNPIPLINQPLIPASAAPGGGGFTLTVNGTGFTSNATVYWNGSLRATTVVSGSQVQAQITAADIAKPGFGWVTVGNLGTGEVQSNVIYFPIRTAAKGVGFLPRSIQNVADVGPVVVGDFNNDWLLDFAVGGGTTGGIQVFLGKGNGTFQLPITTATNKVISMVAGDFNGDGKLDLGVLNIPPGRSCCWLSVFLGDGNGTFTVKQQQYRLAYAFNLSAADFNSDGKLDLYFGLGRDMPTCHLQPCFGILLGNGDGTFTSIGCCDGPMPSGSGYPAIADFNGDGNLDLAFAGTNYYGKNVVDVYLGNGTGGFGNKVSYRMPLAGDSVVAADVNGDGKVDLVTDGVSVLLGNGDGTFRSGISIANDGSESASVGDFNGDGKLDILAGLSLLLGNGDGTFQKPSTFASIVSGFPINVSAFNDNGNLDMLGINQLNGTLSIFEQRPLYFTPTNLNFGSVMIGTTSPPQTAGLTNFGPNTLNLTINITGTNAADFAQTNNCGSGLPSNKSCQAQITFTPSFVGYESASLNVTYQGSAPFSMPLSGDGTNQTFTVTLTPASLTFAAQLLGTTSPPQPATLTNTGNQPVAISSIAATAPFSQTNNCPATLPVSSNCTIQVTFTPTDKGTANGTLSVTDDATGSPQKVQLSGTGTAVVISPTAINFGNQKVGTKSVPVPVTLSNLGTSSLSITQIAIKGTDPNDFTQTNNCDGSVPPQSKCTIKVTFTPKAKGSRSASLSVTDNDPTSPQSVPLSGDGT